MIGITTRGNSTGIDVDVVYYFGDDSLTYCEAYVGVQRNAVMYEGGTMDSMFAVFSVVSAISRNDTMFLSDTVDTVDRSLREVSQGSGAFFPYIFRYLLLPGRYSLYVELLQERGRADTWVDLSVDVPQIRSESGISEMALGAELTYDAESSQFTKHGLRFVPNPSKFYGTDLPMLYYYAECYGMNPTSSMPESVTVTRQIVFADDGRAAKAATTKKLAIPGESMAIADGFPAYTLRTGTYLLKLIVHRDGQPNRIVSKKFYVYRAEDSAQGRDLRFDRDLSTAILTGSADILNTIDPDSGLTLMQYVLPKQEIRRARNMDSEGKRKLMIEFWQTTYKDDPDAPNKHFARVAEANRRYGFLNREGWRTDRGRVFILFGEPEYIDRRYADAAGSDHEIWYYDKLEGGVLFIFVDRSGFGDLDLVHSTKRGEIYNPNALSTQQNQNPVSRGLRE